MVWERDELHDAEGTEGRTSGFGGEGKEIVGVRCVLPDGVGAVEAEGGNTDGGEREREEVVEEREKLIDPEGAEGRTREDGDEGKEEGQKEDKEEKVGGDGVADGSEEENPGDGDEGKVEAK